MAELKGNSLWENLSPDRVTGPAGDYLSGIQTPAQKGVGQNGDIGQLTTNAGAVGDYVSQLVMGPKLGNATFVETGGMCKAPGGGIVPRWSYVNNRASGTDVMPANVASAIGGGTLDGIIPGMFGDLAALNPITILNGLVEPGIPDCEAYQCPVTDATGASETQETRFLTPSLEATAIKRTCKVVDSTDLEASEVAAVKARTEGFGNSFAFASVPPRAKPLKVEKTEDNSYLLGWGLAILLLGGVVVLGRPH